MRIFAARLRNNGKFIDNIERDNEVKIEIKKVYNRNESQTLRRVKSKSCGLQFQRQRENEGQV